MRRLRASALVLACAALLAGCGGGGGGGRSGPTDPGPPATVTVAFIYRASTAPDPLVQAGFPACFQAVGVTHMHPSWRNFALVALMANGAAEYTLTLTDVPVGRHRFRINDPNACDTDPNGATTENIFANGVRLTAMVSTPGNGPEPGLAFSVDAAGVVTP